jgi:hypothetical protein
MSAAIQPDAWHEADRQRAIAELRVARLEHQLAVAHLDWLGLLLRDNLIAPTGARAALAHLFNEEGASDAA